MSEKRISSSEETESPQHAENPDLFSPSEAVVQKTKEQFITDLAKTEKWRKEVETHPLKRNYTPEDFEDYVAELRPDLRRIVYNAENAIESAYRKIHAALENGDRPRITIRAKALEKIVMEGLRAQNKTDAYDQQQVIAGTLNAPLLRPEERVVCRIDNVTENDLLPRSTGEESGESFSYHGVVVFKKDIPPEDIIIESFPEGIDLPKKLTHEHSAPANIPANELIPYFQKESAASEETAH